MFLYSGIDKIQHFNDKIKTLDDKFKNNISTPVLKMGMILVILLEIIGPIIIISRLILAENSPKVLNILSNITFIGFIIFIILVTILYHPFSFNKPIPFLSNCSTLAGIIFLFVISNSNLINNRM
jgi:hypothetical protein